MGEVKHTSSFLRTSLVKDPYCLGDFLEAKDVLRIENEYPDFFSSREVAKKSRSPGPTNPSLQYSKPASGSPYKIPVVPKSCLLRYANPSSTLLESSSVTKKKSLQHASDDEGSRRSYPHITITTRKRRPPSTSTVPSKNIFERSSGISLAPKKNLLLRTHSVLTPRKSATAVAKHSSTRSEVPQESSTCLSRCATAPPTENFLAKVNAVAAACLLIQPASPRISVTHLKVGAPPTPPPPPSVSFSMNCSVKNGPPSLPRLPGERQVDAQFKSPVVFRTAPGFIRPTFSKKTSKPKPLRPQSDDQPCESGDPPELMDRRQHAKYEEILVEAAELGQLKDGGADGVMVTRLPQDSSKDDAHALQSKNPCISRSEQALIAELLAVQYRESGKFGKKLISSKSAIAVGRNGQKLSETAEDEGIACPTFRITQKQKMMLEKIAKELIREEMRTCMMIRKAGAVETFTTWKDDEVLPTIRSEMLQFYQEGIKELVGAGIRAPAGSVQDDSSGDEFLSSSTSCTTTAAVNPKTGAALPKNDLTQKYPIEKKNVSGSELRNPILLEAMHKSAPSAASSTSGSGLDELQQVEFLSSSSSLSREYSSTFEEETINQEQEDVLEKGDFGDNVVFQEDSNSMRFKDFPVLSTIEEAVSSGKSVVTPPVAESDKLKEPSIHTENGARIHQLLQNSNTEKVPTDTNNDKKSSASLPKPTAEKIYSETHSDNKSNASLAKRNVEKICTETNNGVNSNVSPPKPTAGKIYSETNNDVTDCSSISDFILSESKPPAKPIATLTDALPAGVLEQPADLVVGTEEPPMSLMSKIDKFLGNSPHPEQLPEGLNNQSISLLKVGSIPEEDPTDISEYVPSPPETEDESVFENDDSSVSGSGVSFRHICTNLLSHGELLVNQEKSTGEITWPLVHSPGLHSVSLVDFQKLTETE